MGPVRSIALIRIPGTSLSTHFEEFDQEAGGEGVNSVGYIVASLRLQFANCLLANFESGMNPPRQLATGHQMPSARK